MNHYLNVVGIGLRGADGLSDRTRETIDRATVLAGSDRQLGYFRDHPAKKIVFGDFITGIQEIKNDYNSGESVVIFASGDPLFFGVGRLLLENFPADCLRFHPHVSSVQLACSRLKISWQDIQIISLHGRGLEALTEALQKGVEKIALLTDTVNDPSSIARFYLGLSLPVRYQFCICEDLEGETEKISRFNVEEIERLAGLDKNHFSPLNIVVLIRQEGQVSLERLPLFGIPDRAFFSFPDRPNLMTKREIRIAILGELDLQGDRVLWDIGAGTGSVSIECARLCPTSRVYAIEKTAMGITLIEKNCQRFGVSNVIPVSANAPDRLTDLPDPDRIFIGGSGGKLSEILTVCGERLQPDGKIVLALATIEHLQECCTWFSTHHWKYELLQLQLNRSVSVGQFTRWSPLNPVTLVSASRCNELA
ncbi:precorrin-6y C5,15-methyltransferase (decarboxylating) subunit CbiE [Pannus brasiliensis CCIBt3594]|uniref:Precorrin-6y C5,15-methyltransferase (Decarboxylating) subunit CbiE n=1 Tax=Pannus brasiliensis CCIBt3594 TaxID=1427578 RepID=A0AAW9QXJ3_9CHRO